MDPNDAVLNHCIGWVPGFYGPLSCLHGYTRRKGQCPQEEAMEPVMVPCKHINAMNLDKSFEALF